MLKKVAAVIVALAFIQPGLAIADTVKGRIKYVSKKASTIQIDVKGKEPVVVRFDDNTQYENTGGIKELNPPDLIKVEFTPGKAASKISKIVFGLPKGVEIDRKEMLAILQGKRGKYFLGDSRPTKKVLKGHIPSAVPTFPKEKEAFFKALPKDKDKLVVFYCGGPTCPYTGDSVKMAMEKGYTNLKGYQAGIPDWKRAKMVVHSEPKWLAKNLGQHVVILDARSAAESKAGHIKGAVSMPSSKLVEMTKDFIAKQKVAMLPGVSDLRAPIVVYANSHTDRDAIVAFKEIRKWGYKNTSILNGGMKKWSAAGKPTATGDTATKIVFVKKLPKGAIKPAEFIKFAKAGSGKTILDVRSDFEVEKNGAIAGSTHIPLDNLDGKMASLSKDTEILIYCENGIRAEMAYESLTKGGYKARFLNETPQFDGKGGFTL